MLRKQAAMQKQASFQMKFLEVKTTPEGRIRIKGFASTPQIDRYDDIVNPAAFANAMTQYMMNPVILLGHNPDKVLGKVIEYNIGNDGLEITAELSNDIDNTFHNIAEKNLRGFSIGFICKAANYREDGNRDIREITELDLIEISVVSTPANPSSLFTLAKSLRLLFAEAEQKEAEDIAAAEAAPEAPAPVAEETPAPETPTTPEGKPEETPEEEKGKKPSKKEDDEEEDPICGPAGVDEKSTEPETPTQTDPKTEEEAPAGETPATPETVDVPATDKTKPVEGGEETPETPAPAGLTEDEVKSLIEAAVKEAVTPVSKALEDIAKAYKDLEEKHTKLESEHKQLEGDVLKIEVRPGAVATRSTTPSQRKPLTDAMVLRSIGL